MGKMTEAEMRAQVAADVKELHDQVAADVKELHDQSMSCRDNPRWREDRAYDALVAAIERGDNSLYPMATALVRHYRECVEDRVAAATR